MSAPTEVMMPVRDPEIPVVTAEIADPLGHSTELGLTPRDALNVQAAIVSAEDELSQEFSPFAVQEAELDAYKLVKRAVAVSFPAEDAKKIDPIHATRLTLIADSHPENMRPHLSPEVEDEEEKAARLVQEAKDAEIDDAEPYDPFADDDDENLPEFNIASGEDFIEDIRVIAQDSIKAQEALRAQDANPETPKLSVLTAEIGEVALAKQIARTDNPALREELEEVRARLHDSLAAVVPYAPVPLNVRQPEVEPMVLRTRIPQVRQLVGASAMAAALLFSRMRPQ